MHDEPQCFGLSSGWLWEQGGNAASRAAGVADLTAQAAEAVGPGGEHEVWGLGFTLARELGGDAQEVTERLAASRLGMQPGPVEVCLAGWTALLCAAGRKGGAGAGGWGSVHGGMMSPLKCIPRPQYCSGCAGTHWILWL